MNLKMNASASFFGIYSVLIVVVNGQKTFSSLPCAATKRGPRIVGGSDAERAEMPFIVSLTRRGGHFCGATILNENWLITAGHCLCNGLNQIFKPSHVKGIVGLHQFSTFKKKIPSGAVDAPFEVEFKQIFVHPKYDCSRSYDDIALLELKKPIGFSERVKPSCVADESSAGFEDVVATVSGWGWTQEDQEFGDRADVLQKAPVKIWKNDRCQQSFTKNGKMTIVNTQMCAGYEKGGIDACWADSGGPLVTENNILIGIVSTGIGCARPNVPGIYTRVSKYSKWIESVIYAQK